MPSCPSSTMSSALVLAAFAFQVGCTGEVNVASLSGPQQADRYEYSDGSTVIVPVDRPGVTPEEPIEEKPPVVDVPMDPCAGDLDPGIAPMRTLTRQEFEHALGELFEGVPLSYGELPPDERIGSFAINGSEKVTVQYINALRAIAEEIAITLRDEERTWLGCEAGDSSTCTRDAMQEFLPRLYRRGLKPGELDRVMALYDLGAMEGGHAEGVRIMMEALLQSPSFIYTYTTTPEGQAGQTVELDDMQIARRMATLLWRGIPDDELLLAAARGDLRDPAMRRQQAERMIDDPRARVALNAMVLQWFDVDSLSDSSLGQVENPNQLRRAMQRESERLIDHVLWNKEASYKELLTAPYTFVDQQMVEHYGVARALLTDEVEPGVWRVELDGRRGILSHASVLAHEADVIHRGKRIRSNLLCDDIPGPGDDIDTESIPTGATESERSKAGKRMETAPCSACHLQMDNMGLVFDMFDELGVPRLTDKHGNAVDATGEIRSTIDIDGPVTGVADLTGRLSGSKDVQECVAQNLFTYSFARRAQREVDACTMHTIERALEEHDGNLRETLLTVIDTHTFTTTRTP